MATLSRQHNHHRKSSAWRIIGIDPGSVVTGWGVIEARGTALTHVGHGTIGSADARAQGDRLSCIYLGIQEAIKSYRPDGLSLERVFFARNAQSALKLGQARGVALLAAAQSDISGERFNVGAGNPQTINRLVELLGGDVIHVPKRPGEPDCTFADISKIRKVLGWEPKVDFAEGVSRMLAEIGHWRDAPLWDQASIAQATRTWFQYLGDKPNAG